MREYSYTESTQFTADEAWCAGLPDGQFLGYVVRYGEIWWAYDRDFNPLSTHTQKEQAADAVYDNDNKKRYLRG